MACELTSCITLLCGRDNVGGIDEIYVQTLAAVTGVTASSGVITAIAMDTTKKFYTYELVAETGTATEESPVDIKNGTVFYDQKINIRLLKVETAKRNELLLLSQSPLAIIVKNNKGKYFLFGETHGVNMTTRTAQFGTEFGDFNGYEVEFTGRQSSAFQEVTTNLVAPLLATCA